MRACLVVWGAEAVRRGSFWPALAGNLLALGGVVLGIAALAAGAGPRTASSDLYHRMMLGLIAACVLILLTPSGRAALRTDRGT